MGQDGSPTADKQGRYPWEFWLVVTMLVALVVLILVIVWPTPKDLDLSKLSPEASSKITFTDLSNYQEKALAHRKDILSLIVTAFGAWVGAGAAYFFGRENLRVAANGLLAMRDLSGRERLSRTSIKQIPPTPIDWTVDRDTPLSDVRKKLEQEPARWFIPVVKKPDGTLETVFNVEALWRYLLRSSTGSPPSAPPAAAGTVSDLLQYIQSKPELSRFNQIHVTVPMDTTVGAATDLMDSRKVFLAIVTADGKPTHYFTTSEVRKLLLQAV